VNKRLTNLRKLISEVVKGFYMTEENSSKGLTRVCNALHSNREPRELKQFISQDVLATIFLMCGVKNKLL
jgi:hypothetical protein